MSAVLVAEPALGHADAPPLEDQARPRPQWPRMLGPALLVSAGYIDPGELGHRCGRRSPLPLRPDLGSRRGDPGRDVPPAAGGAGGPGHGPGSGHPVPGAPGRLTRRLLIPPLFLALAVTETVELLGVVLGVQILTGWSVAPAVAVSAGLVLAVLAAPGASARRIVYGCLAVVATVYLAALSGPHAAMIVAHARPAGLPAGSTTVAVGIIGSVVMPHNILLQSALARDLAPTRPRTWGHTRAQPYEQTWLRGSLCHDRARPDRGVRGQRGDRLVGGRHRGRAPTMAFPAPPAGLGTAFGPAAAVLFGLTLLASGLASSTTGAMISVDVLGQLVPALALPPVARRAVFLLPAIVIAASPLPAVSVLVWSQLLLTWTLPVVLVPLVYFAARADLMGTGRAAPAAPGRGGGRHRWTRRPPASGQSCSDRSRLGPFPL